MRPRTPRTIAAAALAAVVLISATGCAEEQEPLKIGLLGSSSDLTDAFDMAIAHVNANGGALGKPVEFAYADATNDGDVAVEAARRLVEEEGVHGIVGPFSSANSTRVAQEVTGPAGIPTISPSSTAPGLANLDDNDFFFRTTLSDADQGRWLARIVRQHGLTNVGLAYRDDPYGREFAKVIEEEWVGVIVSVLVPTDTTDYAPLVRQTTTEGAEALIVIDFSSASQGIVKAAVEHGLYDRFYFADAAKSLSVVQGVGGEILGGMYGTSAAPPPRREVGDGWNTAFIQMYGDLPSGPYLRETYDGAMAIMLAAEQAGSVNGADIRDNLRSISAQPGAAVHATPDGVAEALRLIRDGREINFEGAGGALEWDENGDVSRGHIGVWRFTEDEQIEEVENLGIGH